MVSLTPLSQDMAPFWHPFSTSIHVFKSYITQGSQNSDIESDLFVNDMIHVFAKVFIRPTNLKMMSDHEILSLLINDQISFMAHVYSYYSGNIRLMKSDKDNIESKHMKFLTIFCHPCMHHHGLEICLHITTILSTLLKLANWPSILTNKTISDTIETTEDSTSTTKDLTTTDTTSSLYTNITHSITAIFTQKQLDIWSQNVFKLFNILNSINDITITISSSSLSSVMTSPSFTTDELPTLSINTTTSTTTSINIPQLPSSIQLNGTILCHLFWSASQTVLYQYLINDGITSLFQAYDNRSFNVPLFQDSKSDSGGVGDKDSQSNTATSSSSSSSSTFMKPTTKKLLYFGQLWRGRWDLDASSTSAEYTTGSSTSSSSSSSSSSNSTNAMSMNIFDILIVNQVALWKYDMKEVLDTIESVALKQFSIHRSAMKIFLEMVIIKKIDKLILLAKTDRSVMGNQLLTLLSYDTQSDKGRIAIHKNAFALIRLKKYQYALATFLYADPPFLKEACSVACKQMNNPFLGFLIARLVEYQQGPAGKADGLVLGECSKNVLLNYILPVLTNWIKDSSLHITSTFTSLLNRTPNTLNGASSALHLPTFMDHYQGPVVDIAMMSLLCTLWLQDILLFESTLDICLQYHLFIPSHTHVKSKIFTYATKELQLSHHQHNIYHINAINSILKWFLSLERHIINTTQLTLFLLQIQQLYNEYGLHHETIELYRVYTEYIQSSPLSGINSINCTGTLGHTVKNSSYIVYCQQVYDDWVRYTTKPLTATSSFAVTPVSVHGDSYTSMIIDTSIIDVPISTTKDIPVLPKQSGFNLAFASRPTATNTTATQDRKNDITMDKPSKTSTTPSMLDMYDVPPPRTRAAKSNTESSGASSSSAVPNMLDMYDVPPPRTRTDKSNTESSGSSSSSAVPNMLDMYDVPPPRTRAAKSNTESSGSSSSSSSSAVPNMLDIYEVPPPRTRTDKSNTESSGSSSSSSSSAVPNMLDIYEVPPPRTRTDKSNTESSGSSSSSAVPNMLDIYEVPPPRTRTDKSNTESSGSSSSSSSAVPNMLDIYEVPPQRTRTLSKAATAQNTEKSFISKEADKPAEEDSTTKTTSDKPVVNAWDVFDSNPPSRRTR